MKDDTADHRGLALALRECADMLAGGETDQAPLRKLQRVARNFQSASGDLYVRAISFVLDAWIKDYYFNFAGDIVSPASQRVDDIRERFLGTDVATALAELSEHVENRSVESLRSIEKVLGAYLDASHEATQQVGGWARSR